VLIVAQNGIIKIYGFVLIVKIMMLRWLKMNKEIHFKFFHEFLDECRKAREQQKPYWVSQKGGKFVLWVVEDE